MHLQALGCNALANCLQRRLVELRTRNSKGHNRVLLNELIRLLEVADNLRLKWDHQNERWLYEIDDCKEWVIPRRSLWKTGGSYLELRQADHS